MMTRVKPKRKPHFSNLLFTFYFIGLLISSYIAYSEEYIVLCGCVALFSMFKQGRVDKVKGTVWWVFVTYYFFSTIFGFALGLLNGKDLLKFIIQYPIMISVLISIARKTKSIDISMDYFKKFILISCIYGFVEAYLKHNYLPDIFSTPVMERLVKMNLLTYKYQTSSFFLHYTYFGFVILVGFAINFIYPFRNKVLNIVFFIVSIVDLYYAKSRMCLLGLIVLLIYNLYTQNRITVKMIKRGLAICGIIAIILGVFWKRFSLALESIYSHFAVVRKYGFEYGSFGQRFGTLLRVPSYMLENPFKGLFGTGFASIETAFLNKYSYFAGYNIADNQLTTFLIEVGVIGTVLAIYGIVIFFWKNNKKRSLSRYLVIIVLFSSITLDVIGTVYITALVLWSFVVFYEYERRINYVQHYR